MRKCTCDNTRKGTRYTADQCRVCWLFHHVKRINLEGGGTGKVHQIPPMPKVKMPKPKAACSVPKKKVGRPGDELAALFAKIGVIASDNDQCHCQDMINQMNAWKVEGCVTNKDKIVQAITENANKLGWLEYAVLAKKAVAAGLTFINPFNIIGSFVDEAIRRATKSQEN